MIVFLYGKDSYRRLERKKFYTAQFEKKYRIPVEILDLTDEDGLEKLEGHARSQSLFESKKLIVAENMSEAEPKKLVPILKQFAENKNRSLLFSEEKKPA